MRKVYCTLELVIREVEDTCQLLACTTGKLVCQKLAAHSIRIPLQGSQYSQDSLVLGLKRVVQVVKV